MHAVGIWCKTKIQIDPGGLEVNFSLQEAEKTGYLLEKVLHSNWARVIIVKLFQYSDFFVVHSAVERFGFIPIQICA